MSSNNSPVYQYAIVNQCGPCPPPLASSHNGMAQVRSAKIHPNVKSHSQTHESRVAKAINHLNMNQPQISPQLLNHTLAGYTAGTRISSGPSV